MNPLQMGTATDMPIEIQSISCADHICFREPMRKVPQGLSENSQSVPFSAGESRKRLINESARLLLKSRLLYKDKAGAQKIKPPWQNVETRT
jgi:hypothetical protein